MKLPDRLSAPGSTALLILTFLASSVLWFQFGPAASLGSTGVPLLDVQVEYTAADAYEQLSAYGEIGRDQYALFLAGDYLWVLLFGITAISLIHLALRRSKLDAPPWTWILWVPVAVIALDWVENTALLALTLRFPGRFDALASGIPAVTSAKLALSNVSLGLLAVSVIGVFATVATSRRKARRRRRRMARLR